MNPAKLNSRKGRISERQQQIMLDFFECHRELLRNKFTPVFTAAKKSQLWDELAGLLNSNGLGPEKRTEKWIKTWTDWKCLTKAKAARVNHQHKGTGGGPSKDILTPYEEKVMSLISIKSATGMDVEEGGFASLNNENLLSIASTELSPLHLQSIQGEVAENVNFLEHIPVVISSNCPTNTEIEEIPPPAEDTFAPGPSEKKKLKTQKKVTRAAFDSATAAFQESEARNVAAREGIRAACESIASAAEKQASATQDVAAALNNIAGALLAIAEKLNK